MNLAAQYFEKEADTLIARGMDAKKLAQKISCFEGAILLYERADLAYPDGRYLYAAASTRFELAQICMRKKQPQLAQQLIDNCVENCEDIIAISSDVNLIAKAYLLAAEAFNFAGFPIPAYNHVMLGNQFASEPLLHRSLNALERKLEINLN